MGNIPLLDCCCRVKQSTETNPDIANAQGLFEKMSHWQDALDEICQTFPLKDTNIKDYHDLITRMGKKQFTMQDLKETFSGFPAWQAEELWVPGSDFEQLLRNYLPQMPDQNSKQGPIHWISAMSLGLLWCNGPLSERAEVMFATCNPKGESQKKISWNDDEMSAVLHNILTFATTRMLMFHFRSNMSAKTKKYINSPQRRKAIAAMIVSEDADRKGWIPLLFGDQGVNSISKDQFITKIQQDKLSWIFNREDIRYKMDYQFMDEQMHADVVNMAEAEQWQLEREYQPSPRGIREGINIPISTNYSPQDM